MADGGDCCNDCFFLLYEIPGDLLRKDIVPALSRDGVGLKYAWDEAGRRLTSAKLEADVSTS